MRILSVLAGLLLLVSEARALRVKDAAALEGVSESQLIGYGIVVGLRGTGDGQRTQFTTQSVLNMLRNMGIEVPRERIQVRNVAAVMVTARLNPFLRKGSHLDVTVSSLGDAKSLEGGTLLLSPLQGPDGEIQALAQGPLSLGGYSNESASGRAAARKNHALVGEIPGGAVLQKEVDRPLLKGGSLRFILASPDFTSAVALAKAVNDRFGKPLARAEDAALVQVTIPEDFKTRAPEFLAEVEGVEFQPSVVARVVLNEKTGTVIAGANVAVSEVAVSHGNITVEVKETAETRVQGAIAPGRAAQQSVRTEAEDMKVAEGKAEMKVIPASTEVGDLARSLNALGVSARDIIAIFQAIKKAGALHAELVVM